MIKLIFNSTAIPRTTTREQWREIYRWKRTTEKKLEASAKERIKNMVTFGTSHPEILSDYIDRLVNPPVMPYPPFDAKTLVAPTNITKKITWR